MAEYIESVCRSCFHSYVCEQFNEHRNSNNKKCHFFNDQFVPAADVVEVVRCKDCKYAYINSLGRLLGIAVCQYWTAQADGIPIKTKHDDFCSHGERRSDDASD